MQINNCQFNNNGNYAAYLENVNVKTYTGNTGSGNLINAFGISGTINQDITLSQSVCGFPYVIIGALTLNDGYIMDIPAGEVIKGAIGGARFIIYGTINANGTEANPIIFTSLKDDSYGDDLNGDGNATSPAPSDWGGFTLNGQNDYDGIGWFDHCKIRFGGYFLNYNIAVYFNSSDTAGFYHSSIDSTNGTGLQIANSSISIRNSIFRGNTGYGIYLQSSKPTDLGQNNLVNAGLNRFIGNDNGNIHLYNASNTEINAYYNDWGYYTEAEIDAHIYDDDEYASYGEVHFNPWYDPSNPPLVVNFGADTLWGEAPLAVQFTDSTLYNPTSWEWDFENDGMVDSYDQNPEHWYFDGGLYSVKLTAGNGITNDTFVRTDYIDISPNQHLRSYALDFDGVDDFVEVPNFIYPEDLTIEAWIKPENFDTYQEIIYFIGDHSVQFRMNLDGSIVFGEYAWDNWNYVLSGPDLVYLNQWNHIAVSKFGDQVNLYINGVHVGFSQFDNNPLISTLYFGTRSNAMDRYFSGAIDEVRIWSRSLAQMEIQANMTNYLSGTEADLLAYYRLNDVAGQVGYDLTGNGYNAFLGSSAGDDVNDPVWLQTNWPYDTYLLADFTADQMYGHAPQDIQFFDFSMNEPETWQWDFENDGSIDSYDQNPLWTYQYPGVYTVRLVVSKGVETDTIIKYDFVYIDDPIPMSIAQARMEPLGTIVTIEGIVTCGNEYGNLHFIQDETAGAGIYDPNVSDLRMGDLLLIQGETTEYNGLFELINISYYNRKSMNNPMPQPQLISINDLGENYEAEVVRINQVDFPYGGNSFDAGVDYDIIDPTATTHFRLHINSDLRYQRAPENTVSITGICVNRADDFGFEYGIYARDYSDLIYNNIVDFEKQANGFTKRYSFITSMSAADENTAWAIANDGKNQFIVNEFTRTVDGGMTWQSGSLPNHDGLQPGSICAVDANNAWVCSYRYWGENPQGIYHTFDGGITWNHQPTAVFDQGLGGFPNTVYFWDVNNGVCFGDPSEGYFEVYTTTDGGNNWNRAAQSNIPDPIADEYGQSDLFSVVGNTIWFPTNKGRIYKSVDMGLNWTAVQTPLSGICIVEFKNQNEGLLLSKSNGELYETLDGGASWNQVFYSGDIHTTDLKFIPGTPGSYVITGRNGSDAGASYTLDNGQNWFYFPETHGVHMGSMDWISPTCGFLGANNVDASEGGMWKYDGFGVGYSISWDPVNPTENNMITITITNPVATPWLHWGVNDMNFVWQTPDHVYWPEGSVLVDPAIQSPFTGPDQNNTYTLQIGPFNDPAQWVDRLAFVIYFENDTWDNNNGQDYHINIDHPVQYSVTWDPEFPSENDAITITAGPVSIGGNLHWGIENSGWEWQTPDMAYWPPNSFLFMGGPAIQSPFTGPDENGMITITLNPFNNPAQTVDAVNFVINYYDNTWDNNNGNNYYIPISHQESIQVDVTVFLEGPYNGTEMNTDLNAIIPLQQSLTVIGYSGTEEVEAIPNADVVDWIGLELRDAADVNSATEQTTIGGGAFFLLKDGSIVSLDGSSVPEFEVQITNDLFVVVWHRNHLPVISQTPCLQSGSNYIYDFTWKAEQAYGDNQRE
ncbi:MAG: LamG-like jellyroll fold domain-containing protein [Bacteroidales bacterium]